MRNLSYVSTVDTSIRRSSSGNNESQNCCFILLLQLVEPSEATQAMLRDVHTEDYLLSINSSSYKLAEVNLL